MAARTLDALLGVHRSMCRNAGLVVLLGVAFSRMMVLSVMLTGSLCVVGLYWFVNRWNDWRRFAAIAALFIMVGWTLRDVSIDLASFNKRNR